MCGRVKGRSVSDGENDIGRLEVAFVKNLIEMGVVGSHTFVLWPGNDHAAVQVDGGLAFYFCGFELRKRKFAVAVEMAMHGAKADAGLGFDLAESQFLF